MDKMSYINNRRYPYDIRNYSLQFSGFSVKESFSVRKEVSTMKENFKIAISQRSSSEGSSRAFSEAPSCFLSIVGLSLVMYYFFDNNLANLVVDGQLQIIKIVQLLVMAIGLLGGMIIGTAATPKIIRKVGKKAAL